MRIRRGNYIFVIKRHVIHKARRQGLEDFIVPTIKGGEIRHKYGKNRIVLIKRYPKFNIMCVDELRGYNEVHIFSISKYGGVRI